MTMIKNWSEKSQLLIVVLIFIVFTVILGWIFGGWILTVGLLSAVIPILFLARRIWISDKSNFLLRSAAIGVVSLAFLSSNSFGWNLIAALIQHFFPNINLPTNDLAPATLLFLLLFTFLIFHYTKDNSSFSKTEKPIDKLIEGLTIKQKWENVCRGIEAQIRDIDRDTNWSNEYYTPLEAEVEMRTSEGTKKVVKDLLEAIKESNDRLFLLIGDPGAGKSVALRKLSLDILKDSVKTEYIPIYINLKEWVTTQDWTSRPPIWQDLEAFVKDSLGNKDRHLADFFDKHYDVLDENGNLFFILDSFDEIPQVLGTTAESKLIEDLTKVCREFLVGAKQARSRGILASREYRMPRADYLEANTTFRVRPFTYEKIEHTLLQNGKVTKESVEQVFRDRRDLIPILRNPFITSLFQNYLIDNKGKLPQNQAEMFFDYIEKSVEKSRKRLGKTNISLNDIVDTATEIAKIIFSESGLQAPVSVLRQQVKHPDFDEIIMLLRYTRIARGNTAGTDMFSFTHRRFYEYFVVRDLLKHKTLKLPLASIPTDSRWRDTLVLYCEVAPFKQAQRIANYCWYEVIAKKESIRNPQSKHCLRFLSEAFKSRQECLQDFYDDLAEFILSQIHKENDPIDIKISVEALGILNQMHIDEGAIMAFKLRDTWINETTLRSCRHLDSISEELQNALFSVVDRRFLFGMSIWSTLLPVYTNKLEMSKKELLFSFSLSEAFKDFKLIIQWHAIASKHSENFVKYAMGPFVYIFLGIAIFSFQKKVIDGTPIKLPNYFEYIIYLFYFYFLIYFFMYNVILRIKHFSSASTIKKGTSLSLIYSSAIKICKEYMSSILTILLYTFMYIFILVLLSLYFEISLKDTFFASLMFFNALIVFPFLIYSKINAYIKSKKHKIIFNNIVKPKLSTRPYIASAYISLLGSRKYQEKLIAYLENNVKEVSGEYPEGFLKVGMGAIMTRLIQQEERWREVEERNLDEVEAVRIKKANNLDDQLD